MLEVLVAFAILAVMLVPVLQIFGGGLGMTGTARTYAEAALLARSKLAEIGADTALEEGEKSGNFDERGYHWRATIARDTSDVTLPDNTVVGAGERRQSRFREGRNTGGISRQGFSRSGFGQSSSGRGQHRSSFGSGNSSFSSGNSGFGKSGSAFGSSRSGSAQSSAGSTSSLTQGGNAAAEEGVEEDVVAQLVTYQITVTVDWSGSDGSGEVTLTSLRVGREAQPAAGAGQ